MGDFVANKGNTAFEELTWSSWYNKEFFTDVIKMSDAGGDDNSVGNDDNSVGNDGNSVSGDDNWSGAEETSDEDDNNSMESYECNSDMECSDSEASPKKKKVKFRFIKN